MNSRFKLPACPFSLPSMSFTEPPPKLAKVSKLRYLTRRRVSTKGYVKKKWVPWKGLQAPITVIRNQIKDTLHKHVHCYFSYLSSIRAVNWAKAAQYLHVGLTARKKNCVKTYFVYWLGCNSTRTLIVLCLSNNHCQGALDLFRCCAVFVLKR